jgi:hypothetical protein
MGPRQSVVAAIAAAVLGVLVAQPLAGTAAVLPRHAAGLATPQLTVPSATVPSVTVPSATVPSLTVPSVSTPVGTTPSVTTPSVTTPRATTPTVTVAPPAVSVPSVSPSSTTAPIRTVTSTASALANVVTRSAHTSGAPEDPASAAPDQATAARTAAPGSAAGGASTAPSAGTSTAPSAGTSTASGAAIAVETAARRAHVTSARGRAPSHRPARARRLAAARESRRLHELVARLHDCLGVLHVGARRLLTLRAGLHGPARSAAATARILRVSPRREARLERRAMTALRRTVATSCAGAPGAASERSGAPAGASAPTQSGPEPAGSPPSGPSASLSAVHASRPPRGGRRGAPGPRPSQTVEQAQTGSSIAGVLVPAMLALLSALALLALPEIRRRWQPAGTSSGADASAPRHESGAIPAPAAPIAYSAIAKPRTGASAGVRPTRRQVTSRTGMDDAMAQMAADVFAAMTRDPSTLAPHPQPEGESLDPQVQVQVEELVQGQPTPLPQPARWRPQAWAREHATQAALVATVTLGWFARLMRRGRRRRRRS